MLKRYAQFDPSEKGTQGADPLALLTIPEFLDQPFMPSVVAQFTDPESDKVFPEAFLYMCASLSSKTPIASKRQLAFR